LEKAHKLSSYRYFLMKARPPKFSRMRKVKLDSGLFTFYVGKDQGKILGYAAIETSTVRTKPETLMIVLTPDGELRQPSILLTFS